MAGSTNEAWPYYFHPLAGEERDPRSNTAPLAVNLIDIFYLRAEEHARAELVVVARCLGGGLEVMAGNALAGLPDDLRTQLKTAEINRRHSFRTITARRLFFFALDAIEQEVYADGFNDAIFLYGRLHAVAHAYGGDVGIVPLAVTGRITAGRLDMLHAYRLGAESAFHHPHSADERVYNLLVPGDTFDAIRQGDGLVLVYPILDPATFTSVDNVFLVLRIVYDLLARLQHDMLQDGSAHPFTNATIPVPSRKRLEAELVADGYEIYGEVAIRQAAVPQAAHAASTFLGRLRALAWQWTAPRIALPPQATPEDYHAIAADLLPTVVTAADGEIMGEVSRRVTLLSTPAPAEARTFLHAPTGNIPPPSLPVLPLGPITPTQRSPASAPAIRSQQSRKEDWTRDFGAPPSPAAPIAPGAQRDPAVSAGSPNLTSRDDWTEDFLTEQSSAGRPTVRLSSNPATQNPASSEPMRPAIDPAPNDWADDFE